MSYLDIAAAATKNRDGTSFLVGGLRPSLVVRHTSLSHEAGDRIEGTAFAQFGALADTEGGEEPGQTLRATSLDAVSRRLLQVDSSEWSPEVVTHLSDAVRPAADALFIGNVEAKLQGVAAALLQWPHVAVATCGCGVAVVTSPGATEVVLGQLRCSGPIDAAGLESASWLGQLSQGDILLVGNGVFARSWSQAGLVDFIDSRRTCPAETLAMAMVGDGAIDTGAAASVLVARLCEGDTPVEAAAASTDTSKDGNVADPDNSRATKTAMTQPLKAVEG